jgi:two-component system, NtrC family, response regulator AtoC
VRLSAISLIFHILVHNHDVEAGQFAVRPNWPRECSPEEGGFAQAYVPMGANKNRLVDGEVPLPDEVLFGRSRVMADVRRRAQKIAHTDVPVLLWGEAGTGKESLARWIHANSAFRNGTFVKVSCAAIPGTLLESELFGYEKGSFTGAQKSKPGRVEQAQNGTLFLDEISDLDSALQSKLLHFLQDGCFSRIGDELERTVNARLICSTNKDLAQEIGEGRFRSDLFYRISVIQIRLPRLSERREDIPAIAEYLRARYEKQFCKESEPLSAKFSAYLQDLNWPGNTRELANGIARYVLMGAEAAVTEASERKLTGWKKAEGEGSPVVPLRRLTSEAIREMERNVILEALRANQWNRRKTAQELKISYRALIYKIRDAGLAARPTISAPEPGAQSRRT